MSVRLRPRLEVVRHGPSVGEAPTLVFLHEGLGSVSQWRDFPQRLAAATGLGAVVYSRAGYGRSERAPPPWPLDFMEREAVVLELSTALNGLAFLGAALATSSVAPGSVLEGLTACTKISTWKTGGCEAGVPVLPNDRRGRTRA